MEDGAEECALCNDGDQLRPRLSSRERLWRPSEGGRSSRTATQKDRPIHRQLADWLTSKSFALFRVPQENSAAPQSCWMSKGRNHRTPFSRLLRSLLFRNFAEWRRLRRPDRLRCRWSPPWSSWIISSPPLNLRDVKTRNETATLPFRIFKIKTGLKV